MKKLFSISKGTLKVILLVIVILGIIATIIFNISCGFKGYKA